MIRQVLGLEEMDHPGNIAAFTHYFTHEGSQVKEQQFHLARSLVHKCVSENQMVDYTPVPPEPGFLDHYKKIEDTGH